MAAGAWTFEPLERAHGVTGFSCGEASLDEYIKRYALTNHKKGTSRTYVAVRPDERVVWAYYSLCPDGLSVSSLAENERRGLPQVVPGILLTRMAVHVDFQERAEEKLGYITLQDALARAEAGARTVGGYFVLVDPLTERARRFYERAGFRNVPGNPTRMLYPMSEIRKLGLQSPQ